MLRPMIQNSLQFSYEMAIKENSEELFIKLKNDIKNTFSNQNIHEANRILLGQIIETLSEQMDGKTQLYDIFSDCIIECPSKYIERIITSSLWWEITNEKFERSLIVRCKMALRAEKKPFVYLNECINTAQKNKSIQIYVLSKIFYVFQAKRTNLDTGEWLLELLGQIQEVLTKEDKEKDQIVYLCDVFLLAVIVLAGYEIYVTPIEQVVISKEERLNLFPVALLNLVQFKCHNIISQVIFVLGV